ncbi:cytochrome P450 [Pseudonocardia spinosispora]|uniref:cytochrome P450 n=1 Tax=Pseudonocardia spinosispora TaxID=103441 RepID=UPI000405C900|nr:cytochrome P450 [Pseudonocardia spinosispora]
MIPAEPPGGQASANRLFLRLIRPRGNPNPYPLYAQLREIAPIVPVRFPHASPRFLATTLDQCAAVLRHPDIGPLTGRHFDETYPGWRDRPFTKGLFQTMAFRSGAEHRFERSILAKHFTPRGIAARREDCARLAESLCDRLARRATAGVPVDIETDLAVPYAAAVIGRLLGIADAEARQLGMLVRQGSPALELAPSPAQRQRAAQAGERLWLELAGLVARRRRRPGSDLVSELVTRYGDEQERLIGSLLLLFSAGFDSPTSMVGLGMKLFIDHPEQARVLRGQPGLVASAVDEVLRCEPPVQVMFRAARRDTELDGMPIPGGSVVLALVAGANRDTAVLADPDEFDVRRTPMSSLSFGGGAHYCLGAHLAKLMGAALFSTLLERFPSPRMGGIPIFRAPGLALRGFEHLPVLL